MHELIVDFFLVPQVIKDRRGRYRDHGCSSAIGDLIWFMNYGHNWGELHTAIVTYRKNIFIEYGLEHTSGPIGL